MGAIRRIAILLHEQHRDALSCPYRIWAMARLWERRGIAVEPVWGVARPIHADLLIAHIDLSYIPDEYWEFLQKFPAPVVNRRVRDIRKRVYSTLLVNPGDGYEGPVIVKTDLNNGGRSERKILGEHAPRTMLERLMFRLRRSSRVERSRLGSAATLARYHVFNSVREVPPEVFENPALVVERFVPERRDGRYVMRMHTFFGDREQGRMYSSSDPFIKARQSETGSRTEAPDEIRQWRHRLALDYAKMDYVIHEGLPYLLDVNLAVGFSTEIDERRVQMSVNLAEGIEFFEREGAGY